MGSITLPTNEDVSTVAFWNVIDLEGWSGLQDQVTIQVESKQQTIVMKIEYCKKKEIGNLEVKRKGGVKKIVIMKTKVEYKKIHTPDWHRLTQHSNKLQVPKIK